MPHSDPQKAKEYFAARYQRKKAEIRARQAEYYQENKEAIKASVRLYYAENREKILPGKREKTSEYYRQNPDKNCARAARGRAAKRNATPHWLTPEQNAEIAEKYRLAATVGWHVDHIIPLQGETVCGLHVPWNLQILSPSDNTSKGNKLISVEN